MADFFRWRQHNGLVARREESLFESLENRIMVAGYTVNGASFAVTRPRQWYDKQLNAPTTDRNFDPAPDGSRIEAVAPAAPDENKGTLHVTFLLNFFDELRRKTPLSSK